MSAAKVAAGIMANHARAGRLDDARSMVGELQTNPLIAQEGLTALAEAYVAAGQYGEALALSAWIRNLGLRIPVLAQIAVAHTRAGLFATKALEAGMLNRLEIQ